MTYGYDGVLKVESDGGVRIVTLNDPDKLNAMTDPLHEALIDVWVHIMRDNDARVVVVTGAGRAFSAGGNIPGFIKQRRGRRVPPGGMRNARMLTDHMLGCHLPVIAAVNGPAVGLGCSHRDVVRHRADGRHRLPGGHAREHRPRRRRRRRRQLAVHDQPAQGEGVPVHRRADHRRETAVQIGLANRVVPADR